jgi:tRNA nucleotidyltransferase (CCA-adding enzyme)
MQILSNPCLQSILKSELRELFKIFHKHSYELKIAGGAVRDILMDVRPHDVDLATNATPKQMVDMFNEENIRIINTNGIAHGTVTVRINNQVGE